MIPKTPGKSWSIGASAKNIQPKINDEGMPKYSNGANILGKTNLYAKIKNIDAQPPKIPVIINSIQCVKFIILSYSVEKRNITSEPKIENIKV